MKIILFGRTGQVGQALCQLIPDIIAYDRHSADFTDPSALEEIILNQKPDVIINTAAYTAVDKAETEPELANQINHLAVETLARRAKTCGALLIHYSTDYIFNGQNTQPYQESDTPNPINIYGKTKLAGEQAIINSRCEYLILRTSWVFSPHGQNFPKTILKLAKEKPELNIINDQLGTPTSASLIAKVTKHSLTKHLRGIYHLTASGQTSWYGFAEKLLKQAGISTPCHAISTADYPTPARRPLYSCLNTDKLQTTLNITLPTWESQLGELL